MSRQGARANDRRRTRMAIAIISSAFFLAAAATAQADFGFIKPAGPVIFTTVGEKTVVEFENKGAVEETPNLSEVQKNNLVGGVQHIGVNATKTLKECEKGIKPKATCSFEVEYKVERKGSEPIAEFQVAVKPPIACPNMSPKFTA